MEEKFSSPAYKRSRAAYMAQCSFEYFIMLFVADAFLAKLLSSVGVSDAVTGIISSFISLAFVFQLLSIALVRIKVSTKKLVTVSNVTAQMFFILIYLVPFMNIGKGLKTAVIAFCILIAYALYYMTNSICFKWANSYVSPEKRASYSAVKEMISLVSGIIVTAVAGVVVDKFEAVGNLNGAFIFIAVSMFIFNVCNFVSLMLIKKEESRDTNSVPMKEVFKNTFGNKNFRSIVVLTVLWDCARYMSVGFMGVYKTKDLLMSVFLVQVINMAANVARMLMSMPFGKYSDKTSFAKGFGLALMIAAAAFFVNIFTTPKAWFLIVIHTVLFNVSFAGTNQNSFNITYSYVDEKYIVQAMAIKNSIGGICGFLASLLGGKILSAVQANGNQLFGINMYGQQLLSAISFVIAVGAIVFTKKVIAKQKVMKQ